jgi:hypothetical protein
MYKKFNLIAIFIGITALVAVLAIATQTEAKPEDAKENYKRRHDEALGSYEEWREKARETYEHRITEARDRYEDARRRHEERREDYVEHQRERHEDLREHREERHEEAREQPNEQPPGSARDFSRGFRGFSDEWSLPPGIAKRFKTIINPNSGIPAPVEKTGQTATYFTGDDGELNKGIVWPNARFTDNSDGTVTDNLTGLIWMKNATAFGVQDWNNALNISNNLAAYQGGLTDHSIAGDWRLPNINELISLIHYGYSSPALPNTAGTAQWIEGDPFTNVQPWNYWTSTTRKNGNGGSAWCVAFTNGYSLGSTKSNFLYVWCVRDGQ